MIFPIIIGLFVFFTSRVDWKPLLLSINEYEFVKNSDFEFSAKELNTSGFLADNIGFFTIAAKDVKIATKKTSAILLKADMAYLYVDISRLLFGKVPIFIERLHNATIDVDISKMPSAADKDANPEEIDINETLADVVAYIVSALFDSVDTNNNNVMLKNVRLNIHNGDAEILNIVITKAALDNIQKRRWLSLSKMESNQVALKGDFIYSDIHGQFVTQCKQEYSFHPKTTCKLNVMNLECGDRCTQLLSVNNALQINPFGVDANIKFNIESGTLEKLEFDLDVRKPIDFYHKESEFVINPLMISGDVDLRKSKVNIFETEIGLKNIGNADFGLSADFSKGFDLLSGQVNLSSSDVYYDIIPVIISIMSNAGGSLAKISENFQKNVNPVGGYAKVNPSIFKFAMRKNMKPLLDIDFQIEAFDATIELPLLRNLLIRNAYGLVKIDQDGFDVETTKAKIGNNEIDLIKVKCYIPDPDDIPIDLSIITKFNDVSPYAFSGNELFDKVTNHFSGLTCDKGILMNGDIDLFMKVGQDGSLDFNKNVQIYTDIDVTGIKSKYLPDMNMNILFEARKKMVDNKINVGIDMKDSVIKINGGHVKADNESLNASFTVVADEFDIDAEDFILEVPDLKISAGKGKKSLADIYMKMSLNEDIHSSEFEISSKHCNFLQNNLTFSISKRKGLNFDFELDGETLNIDLLTKAYASISSHGSSGAIQNAVVHGHANITKAILAQNVALENVIFELGIENMLVTSMNLSANIMNEKDLLEPATDAGIKSMAKNAPSTVNNATAKAIKAAGDLSYGNISAFDAIKPKRMKKTGYIVGMLDPARSDFERDNIYVHISDVGSLMTGLNILDDQVKVVGGKFLFDGTQSKKNVAGTILFDDFKYFTKDEDDEMVSVMTHVRRMKYDINYDRSGHILYIKDMNIIAGMIDARGDGYVNFNTENILLNGTFSLTMGKIDEVRPSSVPVIGHALAVSIDEKRTLTNFKFSIDGPYSRISDNIEVRPADSLFVLAGTAIVDGVTALTMLPSWF